MTIPKGLKIVVGIKALHNDPSVWRGPKSFIPERFDPNSEYYLKPDGTKRDPMSFLPFSAGARNCIG
jgi:cytochrome P450 (family 4 subfamily F)